MGRRKVTKEHIRKIQHSKGSYFVSIPIRFIRSLKWKEKQKVVIKKYGETRIVVADWEKKR